MFAVSRGNFDAVKRLVNLGVDIYAKDHNGNTPVMIAALSSQTSILRYLVSKNAFLNETNELNNSPLLLSVGQGHTKAVRLLLVNGADINKKNVNGHTPLSDTERALVKHYVNAENKILPQFDSFVFEFVYSVCSGAIPRA